MKKGNFPQKRLSLIKEIVTLGVTILALSAALLFAFRGARGYGWFSSNKTTTTSGVGVKVDISEILQFARDEKIPYDTDGLYPDSVFIDFLNSRFYDQNRVLTAGSTGIVFSLKSNDGSNKIEPGSSGTLEFWLVPNAEYLTGSGNVRHVTQNIYLSFEMAIRGYHETGSPMQGVYYELSDEESKFIAGHIMFFEGRTVSGDIYQYSNKLGTLVTDSGDGALIFSFSRNVVTTEDLVDISDFAGVGAWGKKVTLYWVWPSTFGQIVLEEGDPALSGVPLFADDDSVTRNKVLNELKFIPKYYFLDEDYDSDDVASVYGYSSMTSGGDPSNPGDPDAPAAILANIKTGTNLSSLSQGYDNADEWIGDHVKYIVVELYASVSLDIP